MSTEEQQQKQTEAQRTELDDLEAVQRFHDEQNASRPFVSPLEPISSLTDEFKNGSQSFVRKARWLGQRYKHLHRTRGDGDCFYRSLAFQLVFSLMKANDAQLCQRMYAHLNNALDILEQVMYDRSVTEDFWAPLRDLLSRIPGCTPTVQGPPLDTDSLLTAFNDAETTNCIVVFLRLCLSAWLKLNTEKFGVFLFALDSASGTGEPPTMDEFCSQEVEPIGKEADHLQIAALCDFLQVSLDVAYFSRSDPAFALPDEPGSGGTDGSEQMQAVDIVEFRIEKDASERLPGAESPRGFLHVGTLLYRPGHYDILLVD
ncbi:unnamed protein product [Tilletia controversa]|uniref:ubiquitinyl hydrolase 1 n=2 Tax=Tilletia TaxID=13289 RepID=A0A8X7MPF1_9BASI|nr:hypothetical protein CF335_g8765 [Tilletia laevis]KAE8243027.1 hypothetical protein A4X06_0g6605 [Tilletia controversa]CAD6915021.1 unnamed protein product [Tilletia caries]CAD6907640.1 unnamed protein product [Tilletia controversa]CAD6961806.1 unnamed protein product [Tilletia caries]